MLYDEGYKNCYTPEEMKLCMETAQVRPAFHDEAYQLDFPLPGPLKEVLDVLEECCEKKTPADDNRFSRELNSLCYESSLACIAGEITPEQRDSILYRYGLR